MAHIVTCPEDQIDIFKKVGSDEIHELIKGALWQIASSGSAPVTTQFRCIGRFTQIIILISHIVRLVISAANCVLARHRHACFVASVQVDVSQVEDAHRHVRCVGLRDVRGDFFGEDFRDEVVD